jgi:hypothetical protein
MKLDNKIIKALYESQVGGQADADKAKELNQAEQKSFFYITCEFGMYVSNWAYLNQYDKNAKFPFVFADVDILEDDSNFGITRDGKLKLVIGEDSDGEPITWENLLDSDDRSSYVPIKRCRKYYVKRGVKRGMIGPQMFKTRKEAEDLIKNNEEQMETCARYYIWNPDALRGGGSYIFGVKEYTKDDFERDLKRI